MRCIFLYSVMGLFLVCNQAYAVLHFHREQSKHFAGDIDINLYDDDMLIGFVSYSKMPLIPFVYIIHNLYVYPQYRSKGHGKGLLLHVSDVIKKKGARRAYIQSGPFEIVEGEARGVGDKYNQYIQQLVSLYNQCGFKKVYKVTSVFAALIYRIIGIDEDSNYLMVKTFN